MINRQIAELWVRFTKGDDDALSVLFRYFVNDMYAYGLKIVPVESLVKDAIQDVFLHLMEKRKKLILPTNFKAYLFKCLRNEILQNIRSLHRKQILENKLFNKQDNLEEHAEQRWTAVEEEWEVRFIIQSALSTLTDHQREALYLKYTEGCDYNQISSIMEISVPSARTLIYRSVKQVRKHIDWIIKQKRTIPGSVLHILKSGIDVCKN